MIAFIAILPWIFWYVVYSHNDMHGYFPWWFLVWDALLLVCLIISYRRNTEWWNNGDEAVENDNFSQAEAQPTYNTYNYPQYTGSSASPHYTIIHTNPPPYYPTNTPNYYQTGPPSYQNYGAPVYYPPNNTATYSYVPHTSQI